MLGIKLDPRSFLERAGEELRKIDPAEVSWVGDYVHAAAKLSRLPAASVNRALGLELDGDVALGLDADGPLPQLDFQAQIVAAAARVNGVVSHTDAASEPHFARTGGVQA